MLNHIEIVNDIIINEEKGLHNIIILRNTGTVYNLADIMINGVRYAYVAIESEDEGELSDEVRVVKIDNNIVNQIIDVELLLTLLNRFKKILTGD